MATTRALLDALRAKLKSAGWTYRRLAAELGLAESTIKAMFADGAMRRCRASTRPARSWTST